MMARGNSSCGITRPSCVRICNELAAYRCPSPQWPPAIRGAPAPRANASAQASSRAANAPGARGRASVPRRARPTHELMTVDPGRPFPERSVREGPLERDGLVHLGARDAAAGPGTANHRGPQARSSGVRRRRFSRPRWQLARCARGPRLDPVTPLHEGGEPEVRRCLQGVVLFRLGERLVVQRFRLVGIRLHGGKLDEDPGALYTRRGLCSRAQAGRSPGRSRPRRGDLRRRGRDGVARRRCQSPG